MRIKRPTGRIHEGDLTPMIDMTFQLIAFFMVLINFTQTEQDARVQLPDSQLAKPPDQPLDYPITIHLTKDGTVIFGGQTLPNMQMLSSYLVNEAMVLEGRGDPLSDATIIIRAHREARTGKVQELIKVCQQNRFEQFALRAKEDVGN